MPNVIPILGQTDWLAWRSSGIGASEAGAVCGQNPYRTPLDVWLDKTGQGEPIKHQERFEWGHRFEKPISESYAERTGEIISGEQVCYESEQYPFMRATVDYQTDSGRILEVKTVGLHSYRSFGPAGDIDSLPRYWLLQAQQQMYCADRDRVDFAVFLPEPELRIYTVHRDEDLIQSLIEIEVEFWAMVQSLTPPPPENPADTILWSKLRPVGGRIALNPGHGDILDLYTELGEQIKHLEAERDGAKAQLLIALGDNQYGDIPDGRTVVRSVSEIAERTTTTKAYKRIAMTIRQPKKEKVFA